MRSCWTLPVRYFCVELQGGGQPPASLPIKHLGGDRFRWHVGPQPTHFSQSWSQCDQQHLWEPPELQFPLTMSSTRAGTRLKVQFACLEQNCQPNPGGGKCFSNSCCKLNWVTYTIISSDIQWFYSLFAFSCCTKNQASPSYRLVLVWAWAGLQMEQVKPSGIFHICWFFFQLITCRDWLMCLQVMQCWCLQMFR